MNIAYFGSPTMSAQLLEKIIKLENCTTRIVITQKDKPTGKKLQIEACPVKKMAENYNIQVFEKSLKNYESELCKYFIDLKIDLGILFAYGNIIPPAILQSPKYGILNVHPSLLPKYRGASPTIFPFILGDRYTGVTLMKMNEKLDEGPIITQESFQISSDTDRQKFENIIVDIAFKQIKATINLLANSKIELNYQNHLDATYTRTVDRSDGFIEAEIIQKALNGGTINNVAEYPALVRWYFERNKIDVNATISAADVVCNMQKGTNPWPGIWTYCNKSKEKKRVKILECYSDQNLLKIKTVQVEGKTRIKYSDFIKTYSFYM